MPMSAWPMPPQPMIATVAPRSVAGDEWVQVRALAYNFKL
jgi:hypothetical protein